MSKEEFWAELDKHWIAGNMEQFWKLWHSYPEYVKEKFDSIDAELNDPESKLRKEHDIWWANLRSRLVDGLGEYCVKQHCKN